MEKAKRLATAWDAAAPLGPLASGNGTEKGTEAVSEATPNVVAEVALPAAAVEAIREEAAHVAEDATHIAAEQASAETSFHARQEVAEAPRAKSNVADVSDKVLARV